MTAEELAAMVEHTRAWAASPEGQAEIKDAMAKAQKTIAKLERSRYIDPARLREPVTI